MKTPTSKDLERFWSKVDKTSGGCWLWTSQLRGGYGLFRLQGKVVSAHRLSYYIFHGELPSVQIRHSCDIPACINPGHLLAGTAKLNSDDKMHRDRHDFSLSNEQVIDIRSREQSTTMCRDLAIEFDVGPDKIKKVLSGEQYAWIPGAIDVPPQFTGRKLSKEDVEEILSELKNAKWGTQTKLAKRFGVTRGTISHINTMRLKYARNDTE